MFDSASQIPGDFNLDRRLIPRVDPARRAHGDAIYTLARTSELLNEDTGGHIMRIRAVVQHIALALGFEPDDAEALGLDAMLHDVGKLTIPPDVLAKPGGLSREERMLMESHTIRGQRMLSVRPAMLRAARIARSHHERYDGGGYPDGLVGDAIPIEARITATADVLDALFSDRCYKEAWTYQQALEEVCRLAGTQLDPMVTDALRKVSDAGSLREALGLPPNDPGPRQPDPHRPSQ
ncbi:MAG: HD-GYP domain-containing protein [Phycisphaerales bacterium]|nr:MAG: HD-GYP domain-containing protein [Phycisphaerales bacterium]